MKTTPSLTDNPLYRKGEYQDGNGRDYFFDNAKFILIVLVVIAHFIEPLQSSAVEVKIPLAKYLWRVINTLHMPCMLFISGYFAKGYTKNKSGHLNVQRVFTYTVLYTFAQTAMIAYAVLVAETPFSDVSFFEPQTGLWYLQVLLLWHLVLPVIDRFDPKYAMAGVVIMGLLVGYDHGAGTFMSMSRAISHFPFFMAGYYFKKEHLEVFYSRKFKRYAPIALAVVLAAFYFLLPFGIGKLPGSKTNYWNLSFLGETSPLIWWGARLFSYVSSVLLIFGFLCFVPRSWTFFTRFGARTLQVYIIHLFLFRMICDFELWAPFNSVVGLFALIGIAIITALILSLKIFSCPFTLLQSINIKELLRKDNN